MCRAARPRLVSGGSQTEKANHWFEIAIVVQQQVATLDAEGADDKIDPLADRAASPAGKAVVRRRLTARSGSSSDTVSNRRKPRSTRRGLSLGP